jgi:SSS family solute:Na+ symporter
VLYKVGTLPFRSDLSENQWASIISFAVGLIVMVIATRFSTPKTEAELEGLVYGRETYITSAPPKTKAGVAAFAKNPVMLGGLALALCAVMYLYIALVAA